MYIEPFWIAVIAIVIIYLVWRVTTLKSTVLDAANMFGTYQKNKESLERDLVKTLTYFDSQLLTKLSEKNRDKILTEQANELRCHFKNNYAEPMYLNGKLIPLEEQPMHRLSLILDIAILDNELKENSYMTVDETINDIKLGLEHQIEQFD